MKEQVEKPVKGLHTDYTPKDQPKDTYRFALNAVDETLEGDSSSLINDESNEICAELPTGYQIIGKCYISNDRTALFLCDETNRFGEIGILDSYCKYTTIVNDSAQIDRLGFRIDNQIDATYRLRRGCEDVVYFVDGNNDDRFFNFGQTDDFKDIGGDWDFDKFRLEKVPEDVPTIDSIEVKEEGNLPPGSYSIGISLVDEDFNSTEVLVITEPIIIFNDRFTEEYKSITGSTTEVQDFYKYGNTSKSIELTLGNFDDSYRYYRIFLIESNVANGQISKVSYSDEIEIDQTTFVLSGDNTPNAATVSELLTIRAKITASQSIEQVDNRLIRGNSKGSQRNYCEMQQLASQIRTDLALKEVVLNDINIVGNPKRATIHEENSLGYMPGEIYAIGVVYEFPHGEESPAFHIPGKSPTDVTNNMSSDNELTGITYSGGTCEAYPYWGSDNMDVPLEGVTVRHHRFPTRSEAGIPLFTEDVIIDEPTGSYIHTKCVTISEAYNDNYNYDTLYLRIKYDNAETGEANIEFIKAIPNIYVDEDPLDFTICLPEIATDSAINPYTINQVKFVNPQGNDHPFFIDPVQTVGPFPYIVSSQSTPVSNKVIEYKSQIMGFDFSNIVLPSGAIGYHIVRMDRDEANKTVLDTGILSPLMVDSNYEAFGAFNPDNTITRSNERWVLHNPEFKFSGKEYTGITSVVREGLYTVTDKKYTSNIVEDVQPGTSYDSSIARRRERDEDGYDLHTYVRVHETSYTNDGTTLSSNITDVRYLGALSNTIMQGENVFNASADNRVGILEFDSGQSTTDIIPYVSLRRDLATPYSNFRTGKYYKEHTNKETGATFELFNGDTYISPMNMLNTIFYDIRLRNRSTKTGAWRIIAGVLLIAFGVLATVLSLGLGAPVTAFVISAGLSSIASGVNQAIIRKTYQEEYEKGLKETIKDGETNLEFGGNPPDDEIQYFADMIPNLWLESSVNMNWRTEPNYGPLTFQYSPDFYNANRINDYMLDKLSIIDTENESGRLYQGFANAEVYFINKDHRRRNRIIPKFALGPEYDCCSECLEEFPHRVSWSEQSFQEELTDNYRVSLANNYRDIEGEKGVITDLFTIKNNLYIHTAEGLWHLPQNIQERITNDVVSFIGTGEYFGIPPRIVVDDETGLSAGNEHKWGTLKSPYGVFFTCEAQRVIYQFNGNNLKPISSLGNFSMFKKIIPMSMDEYYRDTKGRDYPYRNNPANKFGTGFNITYDSKKERIFITKRDIIFTDDINNTEDFEVSYYNGDLYLFTQYQELIDDYTELGYTFVGIVNEQMIFEIYNEETEEVETVTINGIIIDEEKILENSWTISYSLKNNSWRSFHSFLPQFYIHTPERFFSFINGNTNIWRHNRPNHYQNYYGERKPYIIDFISNAAPGETSIYNHLRLISEAEQFSDITDTFNDERFIIFNKAIFYNSRQCSGELVLQVKDTNGSPINYLEQQVQDLISTVLIDRNERDWTLNDFRDIRVDYTVPIWSDLPSDLQSEYFIDKILNTTSLDFNKDWSEMEVFRDKYLGIRLIFDTFDNIKLSVNYSLTNEQKSFR